MWVSVTGSGWEWVGMTGCGWVGKMIKPILKYKNTLAFWRSELNVIGMKLLVLRRSVLRKLKQKLDN